MSSPGKVLLGRDRLKEGMSNEYSVMSSPGKVIMGRDRLKEGMSNE